MSQTTKKLEEYLSRRLEEFELAALMLDGLEVAGQTVVVTLGITIDGTKVPLGIWLGSTENSRVCTAMLQDLLERGLRVDASILCVVDGGKGIRKALVDVLGDLAVIQRLCLLFIHPRAPNLISLRSAGTMLAGCLRLFALSSLPSRTPLQRRDGNS